MLLSHVNVIDQSFRLQKDWSIRVEEGRIVAIGDSNSSDYEEETEDLRGLTLVPGFIDLHIHGAMGEDTSDGSASSLARISSYLVTKGVTGFCPTTMMISKNELRQVLEATQNMDSKAKTGARMLGVRLEGPFLSKEKCGVQNISYAAVPSIEYFREIIQDYPEDLVRIIDLAPELPGAKDFIASLKDQYVISIAHTAATYECCKEAIKIGAKHGTHLFNAMNPLHHHEPGAVGALIDSPDTTCELICDGLHVHPAVLKMTWKLLGCDRIVVVSDAMRAAGMPDGVYDLGGTPVTVRNGKTDFGNGRLAGSTTNLHAEMLYLVSIGIPFEEAVKACTINPARVLQIDADVGSLEVGKYADIVALDQDLNIRKVWVQGELVFDDRKRK